MNKKIVLSILLVFCFVFTISPVSAQTSEQPCLIVQGGQVCMIFIADSATAVTPTTTPTTVPTIISTFSSTPSPAYPFRVQTDFTFYRNPQTPLIGTASGDTFQYPGAALSASTFTFNPENGWMQGSKILYARWVLVWNPKTAGSPTGVRIVSADAGPVNIVQMARIDGSNSYGYLVDAVDITAEMQAIVDGGLWKSIGQQTYGNGGNGCEIYASWIEVVWSPK